MKKQATGLWSGIVLVMLLLSACQGGALMGTAPEKSDLLSKADTCREVYTEQVDAWGSGDIDRIGKVYTEDIVHYDGGPAYIGIDDVLGMARTMLMYFSDWEMEAGRTYISASDCLGTWVNWGVMGFTEEEPGREFDLVDIQGDQISYWRLFYDENFGFSPINTTLLENYGAAWSSGDSQEVAGLYAEDALLDDSLFGITAAGTDEIGQYAAGYFKDHPNATWELLYTFSESDDETQPDLLPSHGGIYQVTAKPVLGKACSVQVAVILTPDGDGLIASQKTMYYADDLIQCGWVK